MNKTGRRDRFGGVGGSGFTLIELLVVLVILGLLAGVAGPQVLKYLNKAKTDTARLQIEELGAALDLFYLDLGRYPSGEEGLQVLVSNTGNNQAWNGPYLKKKTIPHDPWGQAYHYRFPGQQGAYDLFTFGADNVAGGDGDNLDVVSWR